MFDPANDQFSDTSLLDLVDLTSTTQAIGATQEPAPVQTPMYAEVRPAQPRVSVAEAFAKAGSIVPGMRTDSPAAPNAPVVIPATGTGSYTPFLLAAVGAIAGGMYAGWWGAATGALGVGAIVNANRWRKGYVSKTMDGAFALATMGGAVYAGYKAHEHRQTKAPKASREPDVLELDEDDNDDQGDAVEQNSAKPARRAWLRPVR